MLLVSACDSPPGPTTVREALDERGIEVDTLFAPPTDAEIRDVRQAWDRSTFEPDDVREEWGTTLTNGESLRTLSHLVDGQRHYGVVIVPAGEPSPASLPVLTVLAGFGPEMTIELPTESEAYRQGFVTLVPSFRGQTLRIGDETWVSDGDAYDQCDGATDDALAFLRAAISVTPEADANRIVAVGGSRGGNVALLAGIRDPDIDGVISVAGPTDFLQAPLIDHPNASVLYSTSFVRGLLDGDEDIAGARARMLSCSPVYFAERLPTTQIHHGEEDQALPHSQAERLNARMLELGRSPPAFEFFTYPAGDHELVDERPVVNGRIDRFILALDYR